MRGTFLLLAAFSMFAAERHIAVISHRGEHLSHPENTLAAYRAAIDLGADYFEADVHTTSDGHFVLMHDSTVDRTTNGKGPVSKLTFAEIRELSVRGEQVPTFEEALAVAKGRIGVYVDAKSVSAEDLVAAPIALHVMTAAPLSTGSHDPPWIVDTCNGLIENRTHLIEDLTQVCRPIIWHTRLAQTFSKEEV